MFTNSIDYTVCSTDPTHYNRIYCNLAAPITKYSALLVSILTANCCIIVLNENDYIEINGRKFSCNKDFSNLNPDTLSSLLNQLFEESETLFRTEIDEGGRLTEQNNEQFEITDTTYNYKQITGFYNTDLPLKSVYDENTQKYYVKADCVGFMLSTPILYLTSNVAAQSYRNLNEGDCVGSKIVMKLNNSFSHGFPIYVTNADFETTMLSNDLASQEFRLVDANMKEVRLLSTLYLCIHIRGIADSSFFGSFDAVNREQ